MKRLIVYNSKTGFTKKYANWIAEEIDCDVELYKNIDRININEYDLLIFGSRIHAGKIEYFNKIRAFVENNKIKHFIIFVIGGHPNAVEKENSELWTNNLTENEIKNIPHFYFQGGLNYEKMGLSDKIIMKTVSFFLNKDTLKDKDKTGIRVDTRNSYDISSKEYIKPLVDHIQKEI